MRRTNSRGDDKVNGHALRSDETRAKMIGEAIEVFAALGYHGASTRTIAEGAGVNLSAIPYHFGGKHELYLAAAQTIANYANGQIAPIIARLCDADRADQATRIDEALRAYIDLVVGPSEPAAWTSFFVRCEKDADDAFRMIHEEAVFQFERALTETVARAIGCDAGDQSLRLRVAIVLASIVNFRTLRNMTLLTLGWDQLNPDRLEQINRAIRHFALGELLSAPALAERPSRNRRSRKLVRTLNERNETMSNQAIAHEYLAWTKQKLSEIEATLTSIDGSVEILKADARKEADRAIARIRTARDAFKAKVDAVLSDASSAKAIADDAYAAIDAEWSEVELAFQDFLTAAAGQANIVKKALTDRAEAQRKSWQSSLQASQANASAAIEHALGEADAALRRLAAETDKVEAKLGQVSAVGDDSWKAIKSGLDETISVLDKTWKKISEAVSKL